MKRIHTFASKAQPEERLSSIVLLPIEKPLLITLMESTTSDFYDSVIDDLAENKSWNRVLVYKK